MGISNLLVAAAAAATLGACAPATQHARMASAERRTTLVIENHNWADMVIYVLRGTQRSRVGSVNSMSTARFKLPESVAGTYGELRIQADPIGSRRTYTSPVINVVPGTQVELRLENNISISSFAVY